MKKARISVRKDVKWGEEKKTRGWRIQTVGLDEGSSGIIRIIIIILLFAYEFKNENQLFQLVLFFLANNFFVTFFLFFMFGIWLQGCKGRL